MLNDSVNEGVAALEVEEYELEEEEKGGDDEEEDEFRIVVEEGWNEEIDSTVKYPEESCGL